MLVPSTFTGWYRKIIMNAEIASETSRSRAQIATTGSGCASDGFASAGIIGSGLTTSGIVSIFYPTSCGCQTAACRPQLCNNVATAILGFVAGCSPRILYKERNQSRTRLVEA